MQAILQLITSFAAILGINAIPAGLVLFGGNSAATTMVLYYLENLIAIVLTAARVRILAPADDGAYADRGIDTIETKSHGYTSSRRYVLRNRRVLITDYLTIALFLTVWVALPLVLMLLLGHVNISMATILSGMGGIIIFQLLYFATDLVLLGPLTAAQAENLLSHSCSRIGLVVIAVVLGIGITMINQNWVTIPFVLLKTGADLTVTVQAFRAHIRIPKGLGGQGVP